MKTESIMNKYGRIIGVAVISTLAAISLSSIASAATKPVVKATTITCYKATSIKKVTAVNPKCPTGWTTKKPVPVKSTPTPVATKGSAGSTIAFNATYKGKIAMLWSGSDVQATVNATGSGLLDTLVGTGSSAPSSQCDSIMGTGTLSGAGGTITVKSDASGKGCAADSAAPTSIAITGNAIITGGTGKYVGATGTLKVTGIFAISSTEAGTKESTPLTITLSGNIVTK